MTSTAPAPPIAVLVSPSAVRTCGVEPLDFYGRPATEPSVITWMPTPRGEAQARHDQRLGKATDGVHALDRERRVPRDDDKVAFVEDKARSQDVPS